MSRVNIFFENHIGGLKFIGLIQFFRVSVGVVRAVGAVGAVGVAGVAGVAEASVSFPDLKFLSTFLYSILSAFHDFVQLRIMPETNKIVEKLEIPIVRYKPYEGS